MGIYVVGGPRAKYEILFEDISMSFILPPSGLGGLAPTKNSLGLGMLAPSSSLGAAASILGGGLGDYPPPPPPPPSPSTSALASALSAAMAPGRQPSVLSPLLKPATKRKAYFAFRFEDIMRVNNVRRSWLINHPDSEKMRSFYDRSIWGKSNARDPEALKALMRGAVAQSSAICVLVGTSTWKGRWVKYEIARSVVDRRGLLAVHINGLNHIDRKMPDPRGYNPLECIGVFHAHTGSYYLYEKRAEVINPLTGALGWAWRPFDDFKDPVPLPRYIPAVERGYVMPLARYTAEYDYVDQIGHANIGAWIDFAAAAAGR